MVPHIHISKLLLPNSIVIILCEAYVRRVKGGCCGDLVVEVLNQTITSNETFILSVTKPTLLEKVTIMSTLLGVEDSNSKCPT